MFNFVPNRLLTKGTWSENVPAAWNSDPLLTPKQPPISTKIHSHMSEGPTVLWLKFRRNRTMRWCNSGQMLITKWPVLTPRRPPTSTKIHSHVSLGPVVLWPEFRRNRPLHWEDIEKVCTKCLTSSQTDRQTHETWCHKSFCYRKRLKREFCWLKMAKKIVLSWPLTPNFSLIFTKLVQFHTCH